VAQRFWTYFTARDWDAMAGMLADGYYSDDRRRVVGAGVRHGRDGAIPNMRTIADLGFTNAVTTAIATRGHRLGLIRSVYSGRGQETGSVVTDVLSVAEVNAANRIAAIIVFDSDDIDAAIEELDARYLAGEAAEHSHTWSLIARACAAFNRHVMPPTTSDWINVDHRKVTAFAPGDMTAYMRATFGVAPDIRFYVEAVHRLTDLGAVFTQAGRGISHEGFEAEWRDVVLMSIEGDQFNRCEVFDETDLDAALARFDELSRPARWLENAASQAIERFCAHFAARDWTALAAILAQNMSADDRRRVVGAGERHGREAEIENLRAWADIGIENFTSELIGIRGRGLALCRARWAGPNQRFGAFHSEALGIVEINADNQLAARVMLDVDDIAAAFEELDARYLVGEAAAHAHTWSVITKTFAAMNRRDLPPTSPDFTHVDRRHVATIPTGALIPSIRAAWDQLRDFASRIETVHRLTDLGAAFTNVVHGTSRDGFDAEWREIVLATIDGDLINHIEVFDEADLDAALARFDELSRPAP
jgi:hypothetical protein